jgi:hypothetical protein
VHFSVQGDHLHLIVEARSRDALARGVAGFEVRVARAVNGALNRTGQVFPDRYHRHDLATPTEVKNALSYVLNNARKHVRHIGDPVAYVDATTSGEGFDGWSEPVTRYRSLLDEDDTEPWMQVGCWTWLLRVGWRKRGLVSPFAVPRAPGRRAAWPRLGNEARRGGRKKIVR